VTTAQIAARDSARQDAIARDAYYRAERRGFVPGYELDDWLAAEAEVMRNQDETGPSEIDDPATESDRSSRVRPGC
jgi:hypothetical protein